MKRRFLWHKWPKVVKTNANVKDVGFSGMDEHTLLFGSGRDKGGATPKEKSQKNSWTKKKALWDVVGQVNTGGTSKKREREKVRAREGEMMRSTSLRPNAILLSEGWDVKVAKEKTKRNLGKQEALGGKRGTQ